jgi:hypothetical protein
MQINTDEYRFKNDGDWRIRIGELGRQSKVIKEAMTRRLCNDLK